MNCGISCILLDNILSFNFLLTRSSIPSFYAWATDWPFPSSNLYSPSFISLISWCKNTLVKLAWTTCLLTYRFLLMLLHLHDVDTILSSFSNDVLLNEYTLLLVSVGVDLPLTWAFLLVSLSSVIFILVQWSVHF